MDTMNSEATNIAEASIPLAEAPQTPPMSERVKKALTRQFESDPTPALVETMNLLEEIVALEDETWDCRAMQSLPDCIDPVESYLRKIWQPENNEKIGRLLAEIEKGKDSGYSVLLRLLSNPNRADHYAVIAGAVIRENGSLRPDEDLLMCVLEGLYCCEFFSDADDLFELCDILKLNRTSLNPDWLDSLGFWDDCEVEDEEKQETDIEYNV